MLPLATLALSLLSLVQGPPPPPPPPPPPAQGMSGSPGRDLPYRPVAGKGSISGVLMSDEAQPKPLRRASVMLQSDAYRTGWTYITDDTGAFTFKELPPGRYSLRASKPTFVTMNHGALKPGRPGQSIVLADGQHVSGLTLKLPRGAVISGTIRDEFGMPVPNANVSVMRFVMKAGERTSAPTAVSGIMRTDDRGVYRLWGLAAGEYGVSVGTQFFFGNEQRLRRVSAAEINAALGTRGTSAGSSASPVVEIPLGDEQSIMPATVYYPGTTTAADAGLVPLAAGEERTGIDITMVFAPATSIEGRLVGPDGKLPPAVTLTMMEVGGQPGLSRSRFGRPSPTDGTFSFNSVPPGQYVITARATAAPTGSDADRNAPLFARADVTVSGRRISNLTMTLEAGATVSGTIRTDAATAGVSPTTFRVGLEAIIGKNDIAMGVSPVTPDANGVFTIVGVTPGRYRVSASASGSGRTIVAKSATLLDADVLDGGFDVTGADVSGIDVTMTNQVAEVSGSLEDAGGRAAPDFYIVVFPVDQKFWTPNSRRIKTARPSADGRFIVRDLPAGDYRIAAVTDVETGEWFEPSFLQQLVAASATLTLTDGEKKSFPLKIGGG